jgi:formylglycine-generating enzyme required for sulfatase activity
MLEPATTSLKERLQRGYRRGKENKALRLAVEKAFAAVGAPDDAEELERYALNLGYDRLVAGENDQLRQEIARATLLVNEPDASLVPESLYDNLRWPSDQRPQLALFLYSLRQALAANEQWGPLIAYSQDQAAQRYLRQTVSSLAQIRAYLAILLDYYDLQPEMDDAQALQEYLAHVIREANALSFMFATVKDPPAQLKRGADLEAVFVPLTIQDPEQRAQRAYSARWREEDWLPEQATERQTVTINDVLARYPVFLLRGDPGSGKSVTLRHVALSFAQGRSAERLDWQGEPLLPILVPLRNFSRFLRDHAQEYTNPAPLPLRRFIEDYFREHEVPLTADFFKRRLDQGHCLVLLDGLDEVADRALRVEVARVVSEFIKHYQPKGNYFGLASRPRGYDEVAQYLPVPVVCDVQPLWPEQRDRLVSLIMEQLVENARLRRDETQKMLQDIRDKRRVDILSRNPLYCTTLVLVSKYRGTTLPERRVDVYQAVVDLMLGFWEAQREGVSDVRELTLMDGTGRVFDSEDQAVEHKTRALTDVADWMQAEKLSEAVKTAVVARLSGYFVEREGADPAVAEEWARGFLNVAHQRSGLYVEVNPETHAFSHQNFREYLAARALVRRRDADMIATVLAHAGDSWWEEVILLAAAHKELSEYVLEDLLDALARQGHLVLAGKCAVDAGDRLPPGPRRRLQDALRARMIDAGHTPKDRYAAGETLDALGWLPDDLNDWARCPAAADDKRDLLAGRYPMTNAQYELFLRAGGYDDPGYWGGETGEAWQWRVKGERPYSDRGTDEPEYWQTARFGRDRRGYPVVGVSWYEAVAYCAWLTALLRRARAGEELPPAHLALIAGPLAAGAVEVRLPAEREWMWLAGGESGDRYPWDAPTEATKDQAAILARANTDESEIKGTSPVAMYPQGRGRPFGLYDMAGNVWEWTASWYDKEQTSRVLRGGSWLPYQRLARVSIRNDNSPDFALDDIGFRVVAPVDSGY